MPRYQFRLFDKNTREEVYASSDFQFGGIPEINHRLHDPDLVERYGGPAVVNAISQSPDTDPASDVIVFDVIIDGVEERLNTGPVTR
jgi:hypothetical protein